LGLKISILLFPIAKLKKKFEKKNKKTEKMKKRCKKVSF